MTFSPKKRFMENLIAAKIHRDLVTDESFLKAIESSLLQLQAELPKVGAGDMATAAANHYRMDGAREFVRVILNLAETVSPAAPSPKVGTLE